MRPLSWVTLLPLLVGCRAILGDYELGATDAGADTAVNDVAVIDSATIDTAVTDTAVADMGTLTGCRKIDGTRHPEDGPFDLGNGMRSFCDKSRGGYTLVAMRANNTNGEVWSGLPATLAVTDIGDPNANADRYLNFDWTLLGFTEVVYDLGVALPAPMGPPQARSRVYFAALTETHKNGARSGLGAFVGGPGRAACTLDLSPTPISRCEQPLPEPRHPQNSFGWVYLTAKSRCYWGYLGESGSPDCTLGTVGGGRVWLR